MEEEKGKLNYSVQRSELHLVSVSLYSAPMALKERLRTPFTMARAPWPPFLRSPTRIPPLVHSVSIGEGLVAIAVIKRCIQQLPNVTILLTTTMATTFDVIEEKLPDGVIHQFTPLETPAVMDAFLDYWKPNAIMLDCRIEHTTGNSVSNARGTTIYDQLRW